MRIYCQPVGVVRQPPVEIDEVVLLIIYDDFDQPLLIVSNTEGGQILTSKAGDEDFGDILEAIGIGLNKTTVTVKQV